MKFLGYGLIALIVLCTLPFAILFIAKIVFWILVILLSACFLGLLLKPFTTSVDGEMVLED